VRQNGTEIVTRQNGFLIHIQPGLLLNLQPKINSPELKNTKTILRTRVQVLYTRVQVLHTREGHLPILANGYAGEAIGKIGSAEFGVIERMVIGLGHVWLARKRGCGVNASGHGEREEVDCVQRLEL